MKHQPERTCIGCRGVFKKGDVVRIVAGPDGMVIDYREKLPGRAAYVCLKADCIQKAFSKDMLSKSFRQKVRSPDPEAFTALLTASITEKIISLLFMAAKAGKLAAGYSAVRDGLEKNRVLMLLFAADISDGTREKVSSGMSAALPEATVLTRDDMGRIVGRELVGVLGIQEKGFADAVWKETERLKGLIKENE